MKKTLRFLTLGIAALIGIAAFSMPTFAQDAAATQQDEECTKIYDKFRADYKTNQAQARKHIEEYMGKCKGKDKQIEDYLTKWADKYDKAIDRVTCLNLFNGTDFAGFYTSCKKALAINADDVEVLIKAGYNGYKAYQAKNNSYNNDAINYAKQAIQMIEAGKAPTPDWKPFTGKDDTLAWLNFTLGFLSKESAPQDAAKYFYKASTFESSIKSSAATYIFISNYYQAEYLKINKLLQEKCPAGVPETDECKTIDKEQDAWLDRWADALARAISIGSKANPPQSGVNDWKKTLTDIFKARYNTEEGVNEYVNSVQSKPLPDPATKPEPAPVREVKQDATTTTGTATEAKPVGTIPTTNTTTTDVAMNNGSGSVTKSNSTTAKTTTNSTAATTTPAKKAPATKSKGKTKRPR